jgi:hypothetical protein
MLFWRLCKAVVRPGAGIESHFRYQHQLKGELLKDIRGYYSVVELAGTNSLPCRPVWTVSEAPGGEEKTTSVHCRSRFDANHVEDLKMACLTGCSHNSPFAGVSKADFDTCSSVHRDIVAGG